MNNFKHYTISSDRAEEEIFVLRYDRLVPISEFALKSR